MDWESIPGQKFKWMLNPEKIRIGIVRHVGVTPLIERNRGITPVLEDYVLLNRHGRNRNRCAHIVCVGVIGIIPVAFISLNIS